MDKKKEILKYLSIPIIMVVGFIIIRINNWLNKKNEKTNNSTNWSGNPNDYNKVEATGEYYKAPNGKTYKTENVNRAIQIHDLLKGFNWNSYEDVINELANLPHLDLYQTAVYFHLYSNSTLYDYIDTEKYDNLYNWNMYKPALTRLQNEGWQNLKS